MQYDANGIRCSKTIPTSTQPNVFRYVYDGNNLVRETKSGTSSYTKTFLYNSQGLVGFVYAGTVYTYRKNLFGDIVAIYNGSTKVAEYAYDAYGKCTIVSDTNYIARKNPFRYRGYYWDSDLQLYYLMSRYYDPQTGRFINADTLEYLDPETIGGLNLYAYCGNNPVMHTDPMGTEWWHWAIAFGIVVVLAALTCVSAGGLAAGAYALTLAANGFASATLGTTVFAFATIGSASALAASAMAGAIESAFSLSQGSSFNIAFNSFMNYGEDALGNTLFYSVAGAAGGIYAYYSQIGDASQASFMNKKQRDAQRRLIHSIYPKEEWEGKEISHIYGTYGTNRNYFIFQTPEEHRAFHKIHGYKTSGGPFSRHNPSQLNFWQYLLKSLGR